MSRILISLVSDQTIPNIEFILEMDREVDKYLFLTTKGMEKKGARQWILDTVKINNQRVLDPVVVDEFSFEDIENKLSQTVNDEDFYIVNLTGGTKVMSFAVYEYFKSKNSEMYYLTGRGEKIKIHPGRKKTSSKLSASVSLSDYLSAYGFNISNQSAPIREKAVAETFLQYFLHSFDKKVDIQILKELRNYRSKDLKNINENKRIMSFLNRVDFNPKENNKLSKYECRYLSGDWLEEYLYYFIMDNFNITKDAIGLGFHVSKNEITNELDVLLMRSNKILLFECKTSIYHNSDESQTFIGETIYKSDSLRNKFGLFAQTTVVTLSDTTKPKIKLHLDRAEASRVAIIGKNSFLNGTLIDDLRI